MSFRRWRAGVVHQAAITLYVPKEAGNFRPCRYGMARPASRTGGGLALLTPALAVVVEDVRGNGGVPLVWLVLATATMDDDTMDNDLLKISGTREALLLEWLDMFKDLK